MICKANQIYYQEY